MEAKLRLKDLMVFIITIMEIKTVLDIVNKMLLQLLQTHQWDFKIIKNIIKIHKVKLQDNSGAV
jgi:uncharacterized protein (UPF0335 family)